MDEFSGGLLSVEKVSGVMRQLGQNPSEAEIQDMVNQVGKLIFLLQFTIFVANHH